MGKLKIKILCILTQVTLIITYITIDIWSIVFNSREYFHVPVEKFHSESEFHLLLSPMPPPAGGEGEPTICLNVATLHKKPAHIDLHSAQTK